MPSLLEPQHQSNASGTRQSTWSQHFELVAAIGVGVIYWLVGTLGLMFGAAAQPLPFWPLASIATLSVLRLQHSWPSIWGAALILNLSHFPDNSLPLTVNMLLGANSSLGAIIGAWVITQGHTRSLAHPRAVWQFIARASLGTVLTPLTGSLLLQAAGMVSPSKFSTVFFQWHLNDLIGVLVFVPLSIGFANLSSKKTFWGHFVIDKSLKLVAYFCVLLGIMFFFEKIFDLQNNQNVLVKIVLVLCVVTILIFGAVSRGFKINLRMFEKKRVGAASVEVSYFVDPYKFDEILQNIFTQDPSERKVVTLALGNIDNLEEINTNYGWKIGDAVIERISKILSLFSAQAICATRLNSTEFAILFPHSAEQTHAILEQIRAAVANEHWDDIQPGLHATITFGFAEGNQLATPEELLQTADARLYGAKRAGKNRVHG